jgi:hypothetical protein
VAEDPSSEPTIKNYGSARVSWATSQNWWKSVLVGFAVASNNRISRSGVTERVGVEPTFADHGSPISWRSAECRAPLKWLRDDAPHPRPWLLSRSPDTLQHA